MPTVQFKTSGKEMEPVILTMTAPDDMEGTLTRFGISVSDAIHVIMSSMIVTCQANVRTRARKGASQADLQQFVDDWKPGTVRVAGPAGKSQTLKGLEKLLDGADLSPKQRDALAKLAEAVRGI